MVFSIFKKIFWKFESVAIFFKKNIYSLIYSIAHFLTKCIEGYSPPGPGDSVLPWPQISSQDPFGAFPIVGDGDLLKFEGEHLSV